MRVSLLSMSYLLQNEIRSDDGFADALVREQIALDRSRRDNLLGMLNFVTSIEEPARVREMVNDALEAALIGLKELVNNEEYYYERLRYLHRYFYNLDLFFRELMEQSGENFVTFTAKSLVDNFPAKFYEDPNNFLEEFDEHSGSIVRGILARMQSFTNAVLAKICHQFEAGQISYNRKPEEMEIGEKGEVGEIVYSNACTLAEGKLQSNNVRLKSGRKRLDSKLSASELSERVFTPELPRLSAASSDICDISKKWQGLTQKQKWLFGGIIAVEVVAIVVAAIFAPASALVTVKGTIILNAKILALLAAAAVLAGTAVYIDRARRGEMPLASDLFAMQPSCESAESGSGDVFDTDSAAVP